MNEQFKVVASYDGGNLDKGLQSARTQMAQTAVAAVKMDSALQKSSKGFNQAGNALTNFGRVAQDAPYGFIGIQNNLNPLLESFQRLKQETGGTGSALKALGSSLIGPAGIGVALSVVSSLFLVLGPAIKDFVNNTSAAQKAQEALNDTLSESAASVAGNVSRLQALVAIAQDITRSDNERKEALGALNKEYDGFNGKLTLANINTAEATKLIEQQTQAIVRQAKIKGVQDLITKTAQKNVEVLTQDLSDNLSLWDKVKNATLTTLNPSLGQADAVTKGLDRRAEKLKEGEAVIKSYEQVLQRLLGEDAVGGTLFKEPDIKIKNPKIKIEGKAEVESSLDMLTRDISFALTTRLAQKKVEPEVEIAPKLKAVFSVEAIASITKGLEAEAMKRAEAVRDIIESTFEDALVGLGESLGNALTGSGGFGDMFQKLFSSLGSGLKQLGAYFIKTGLQVKLFKEFITKNPTLAIVAGIALSALGAAIQSATAKQKAFAVGVRGFDGGAALVGERGPELVQLPRGSNVIPAAQTAGLMNNNQSTVIEHRISGKDLLVLIKRATDSNNRSF